MVLTWIVSNILPVPSEEIPWPLLRLYVSSFPTLTSTSQEVRHPDRVCFRDATVLIIFSSWFSSVSSHTPDLVSWTLSCRTDYSELLIHLQSGTFENVEVGFSLFSVTLTFCLLIVLKMTRRWISMSDRRTDLSREVSGVNEVDGVFGGRKVGRKVLVRVGSPKRERRGVQTLEKKVTGIQSGEWSGVHRRAYRRICLERIFGFKFRVW